MGAPADAAVFEEVSAESPGLVCLSRVLDQLVAFQ